ncbi:MAG: PDZ domain-containing protein [bacterium]|nr:PDZ domain-containing protein [bacterium]
MTHNAERPLYILPFRVVVLAVAGVGLLGFLGGALGSWFLVRRLVRVAPGGERIIERVERVTVTPEDSLAAAARESASSVATILDAAGKDSGQAVAVTADGLFVGVGIPPKAPIQLRLLSGEALPASLARVYPEGNLFFLRVSGTFSVPVIEREAVPLAGVSLAAVAQSPVGSVGARVRLVAVERTDLSSALQEKYPALTLVPILAQPLPSSFQGALLFSADRRLQGLALIEQGGTGVLVGSVIDFTLQDVLKHPDGVSASALSGLRGRAQIIQAEREPLTFAFHVSEVVPGSPWAAQGIVSGDEIQRVNGQALTVVSPFARALLEAARLGKPATVEIRRGAETLTREVAVRIE